MVLVATTVGFVSGEARLVVGRAELQKAHPVICAAWLCVKSAIVNRDVKVAIGIGGRPRAAFHFISRATPTISTSVKG